MAVSLAQLGDRVEYVTSVPDNNLGEAALMHLRQFGLDVSHVACRGKRLGAYYLEPSAAFRGARVVYDRDGSSFNTMEYGDINWAPALADATLFHCSGITCATSKAALDTTMDAVETCHERGIELSCDINYRSALWKYPGADARMATQELMKYSAFVFGDQNEWYVATGLEPIPFNALDKSYRFDLDAYRRYFDKAHRMFPNCRRMLMAHRNQLSFQHHINAGVLWVDGDIQVSRVWDINPIVDQMGVGDAWVAALSLIHI